MPDTDPIYSDSENQSLRKINALSASLTADVANGVLVQTVQKTLRDSFSGSSLNASNWDLLQTGSGDTVSVVGNELLIRKGTTSNTETIIRSKATFNSGAFKLQVGAITQARIANQKIWLEIVSTDGMDAAGWILSGTGTSLNQRAFFYTKADGGTPLYSGPATISAVTAGSGYTSAPTATVTDGSSHYDTDPTVEVFVDGGQIVGARIVEPGTLNTVTPTAPTITLSGGGGTGGAITLSSSLVTVSDTNIGQSTTSNPSTFEIEMFPDEIYFNNRSGDTVSVKTNSVRRDRYTPNPSKSYYVQLRFQNLAGAISATNLIRIPYVSCVDVNRITSELSNIDLPSVASQAVSVIGVGGTYTTVGPAAHDAPISGSPTRTAGRAITANYTAVASGDVADYVTTLNGAQITKLYSIPEAEFSTSDTITNSTTAVQVKAALASNKAYVTGVTLAHGSHTNAGDFLIRTTPVASASATIASNTLVLPGTYNWRVGDMVLVTASTVTGLAAGSYYYIASVSTTSVTFASTRGGSTLAISGTSVSATLSVVLFKTELQTAALPTTQYLFHTPLQGGVGQAIEAVTPTALSGKISWNIQGYNAV